MSRVCLWVKSRLGELLKGDEGFVVMATLGIFLMLFVLGASIYAVGETARQKIRIQNACDAAAYSAAVVQADGLSRMATINRAMAETYIHMTNLQIDYITYRWLRLTAKRFKEDYDNAKEYHKWIVTSFNPSYGWWTILATAGDAVLARLFGAKCNYRHDKEGIGWWCGRGPNTKHNILFNGHRTQEAPQSYEDLLGVIATNSPIMDLSISTGEDISKEKEGSEDEAEYETKAKAEEAAIDAKYKKLIDDLDPNDPDYDTKKAQLQYQHDCEVDELARKYENQKETAPVEAPKSYSTEEQQDLANKLSNTRDNSSTRVVTSVNTQWGSRIAELIDADKKTIQLLNVSLSIVNANMYESMQSTAKFVLTSMLRDPRLPADKALKNISAYFYMPRGNNPYQIEDTKERENNFFSPLYNTEPCERLFLHMAKTDKTSDPLYKLFPIGGGAKGSLKGWGLDQWFCRAGKNPDGAFPTIVRTEGALGIQRAYKDANINETGAGVELLKRYASRGNHIANLSLENSDGGNSSSTTKSISGNVPGNYENLQWVLVSNAKKHHTYQAQGEENLFKKMVDGILSKAGTGLSSILSNFKGSLTDQFCDITPSAGNASTDSLFQMCPKSSDTVALFSEYDWSSGKWICLNRADFYSMWLDYLFCKALIHKCKKKIFFCNYGSTTHKRTLGFGFSIKKTHKGWGHYHFPKWFCGEKPKFQGNVSLGLSEEFGKLTMADLIPPLLPEKVCGELHDYNNLHGYMGNTFEWDKFFVPSEPLFKSETCSLKDMAVSAYHGGKCVLDKKRSNYHSCACFFDGSLTAWNYKGKSGYKGSSSQNTSHKIGDIYKLTTRHPPATIPIVKANDGGAVEFTGTNNWEPEAGEKSSSKPVAGFINGHSRIYGDDAEIFDDRYIGEQCQPWILNEKFFSGLGTIVVGAAMKHENPFVQLFNFWGSDDKDMGNTVLSAFDPPSVKGMSYGGKGISGGNCIWAMSAARAAVRRNRRGGEMDGERMYQVTYDASSDPHNLAVKNPHHYKKGDKWEPDMPPEDDDPKIVGGCVCDGNAEKFKNEWNLCEQDWDATLLPLRYAGQGATSDDGVKWTWKPAADTDGGTAATDVGNKNPLNPHNLEASWHPLDGSSPKPRLDSLLPDGKSRMRLEAILKYNKIL